MFLVAVAILGAVLAGISAHRYQLHRDQLELNNWRERLAQHLMRLGSKLRLAPLRAFHACSVSTYPSLWSGAPAWALVSQLYKEDAQPELQTLGQLISV